MNGVSSSARGIGVIIEENQVYNCNTGIDLTDAAAQDIIIWDNFFQNVSNGMLFSNTGTGTSQVKRVVILSNTLSLADSSAAKGIVFSGPASAYNFLQLVARKNIIRNQNFSSATLLNTGISVKNVQEAIVEDNVINNCSATGSNAAVLFDSAKVQYFKSFNNQKTAGALLRAYDSATSRSVPELVDAAQDSLMVF